MAASKFTQDVRDALIERTATGLSLRDACRAVEVREATVKAWLTRGRREPAGEYAAFAQAIDHVRGELQLRHPAMTADELAVEVSEMARAGSVQAMKLRWKMLREEESREPTGQSPPDSLDELDELVRRRGPRISVTDKPPAEPGATAEGGHS